MGAVTNVEPFHRIFVLHLNQSVHCVKIVSKQL